MRSPITHLALADGLQPGDHAQRRRLPAARRPDEHHELAVRDVEVERPYGLGPVGEHLPDVLENDLCHVPYRSSLTVLCHPRGASPRWRARTVLGGAVVDRSTSSRSSRCTSGLGTSSSSSEAEQQRRPPAIRSRTAAGARWSARRSPTPPRRRSRRPTRRRARRGRRHGRPRAHRAPACRTTRRSRSAGRGRPISSPARCRGDVSHVGTVADVARRDLQTGVGHRPPVALLPAGAGDEPERVGGIVADEGDALVAEVDEVLGRQAAAGDVVGDDRRHPRRLGCRAARSGPRTSASRSRLVGGTGSDMMSRPSARSRRVSVAKCSSRCTVDSTLNSTRS